MYLPDLSHKKGERHAPFWVRRSPALIGQVMTGSLTNYSVAKVVIKTKSPKERLRFFAKVVQVDVPYRCLERGLACAKGRNRAVAQGDVPWRGLERG